MYVQEIVCRVCVIWQKVWRINLAIIRFSKYFVICELRNRGIIIINVNLVALISYAQNTYRHAGHSSQRYVRVPSLSNVGNVKLKKGKENYLTIIYIDPAFQRHIKDCTVFFRVAIFRGFLIDSLINEFDSSSTLLHLERLFSYEFAD